MNMENKPDQTRNRENHVTNNYSRNFEKISLKYVRLKRRKEFLQDCKYFGVIPKFLRIRNKNILQDFRRETRKFEEELLRKIIRRTHIELEKLENLKKDIKTKMEDEMTEENKKLYYERIKYYAEREREKCISRQNKKLRYWIKKKKERNTIEQHTKTEMPFINLSNHKLTNHQESVLKLGAKFILNEKINLKETIPKLENAIAAFPETERNKIRGNLQDEIEKKLKETNRDTEDIKSLKELKKNKDIACIHSDKTNKIVILDRKDYNSLMENKFKEMKLETVAKDPNNSIHRKVTELINKGKWPQNKSPIILNHAPNTPRAFGRYKDHKTPPDIRPIVNKKEAPTYSLEKYMTQIYKQFIPPNETSLGSTEDFINSLKRIDTNENQKMVSFDVVNLYPSINIKEINQIINEAIRENYQDPEIQETLIRTNNLIINQTFFQFNGKIYKQTEGVPMGSPISGILAEIKLRKLEEIIENNFKGKIIFWVRYVDDVFALINKDIDENLILRDLNNLDQNINFTIETEKENSINYLDVKITRKNKTLLTTIYRKPGTNTEIINARCNIPYNYKIASLRSYINRAITICSNQELLNEEIKKIEDIALKNGFKRTIVHQLYKNRIKTLNHIPGRQKPKKKFCASIPFCKGASNILKREANKHNINIPIKPSPNIFQYIKSDRDIINPTETAGIYKINFTDEENKEKCYIGVSKRKIIKRISEHKDDIRKGKTSTAIAKYANKNKIKNIDFNNIVKLANYENHNTAYCREAIEIMDHENACNDMEHYSIDRRWQQMLERKSGLKGLDNEAGNIGATDEDE